MASFQVSVYVDGKVKSKTLYTVGSTVNLPEAEVKSGYTFTGWDSASSFTMPDYDVEVNGFYIRNYQSSKRTVSFYYETGAEAVQYWPGEEIVAPTPEGVSGWVGLPTRMPDEDISVYAFYAENYDETSGDLIEVTSTTIPEFREKLVNSSDGNTRPGNLLDTEFSEVQKIVYPDGEQLIRRVVVILPNGQKSITNYFIRVDISENRTEIILQTEEGYCDAILSSDGLSDIVLREDQTDPADFYVYTNRVAEVAGHYYEILVKHSDDTSFVRGSELFVKSVERPVYGTLENGHPTMISDDKGAFTHWVQTLKLSNNYHSVDYYKVLYRDVLAKLDISVQNEYTVSEYTPDVNSNLYKYLYYPVIDTALVAEARVEYVALSEESAQGAVAQDGKLKIFKVSDVESESVGVIYLTVDGDRISMLSGRKGDEVEYPETIDRKGYTFKGYAEDKPSVYQDSPVSVETYWEKIEDEMDIDPVEPEAPKYSLTHRVAGKDWTHEVLLEEGETIPNPPTPDIDGINVTGWTLESEEPFSGNVMPARSLSYVATTEEVAGPGSYTLTWQITYEDTQNQSHQRVISTETIKAGTPLTEPFSPEIGGCTFTGWENHPAYMPENNLTINGSYSGKAIKYNLKYFVDGNLYHTDSYFTGDTITAHAEPTRDGYMFTGWIGLPSTMPAKDVEVYGMLYSDAQSDGLVSVKYFVDGTEYSSYRLMPGDQFVMETEPTREGYVFSGWTPIYTVVPEFDVVISGQFLTEEESATKYLLQFFLNNSLYSKQNLVAGATIVQPTVTLEGFSGWKNCPQTMPAQNLDIYGEVESDQTFKITYVFDGQTYRVIENLSPGDVIVPLDAPEVEEGKTFSGWSGLPEDLIMPAYNLRVTGYSSEVPVTGDYRLIFKDRNTVLLDIRLAEGATITPPVDPTRENYTFTGWSGLPQDMKMPGSNLTCIAQWESKTNTVTATYTIRVQDVDDASVYNERVYAVEKYTPGDEMVYIGAPANLPGYSFSGWSSEAVVNNVVPSENFDVVGTFTLGHGGPFNITWKVKFNDVDYTIREDVAEYGAVIFSPADPMKMLREQYQLDEKGYYDFKGWPDYDRYAYRDQIIVGETELYDGTYFNVVIKYVYIESDGTRREEIVKTEQQMAGRQFVMPADPKPQTGYIWNGWTGWPGASNIVGMMPWHDVEVTGTWISAESDNGYIAGYYRVHWYLPNYDPNQLNHDPWDLWHALYVPIDTDYNDVVDRFGTPDDITGRDGFKYTFVDWNVPSESATDYRVVIKIKANMTRLTQSYNVIYKIQWYHSATNISELIDYQTVQTPADSIIEFITPTEPDGYMWNGVWEPVGLEYKNSDGTYTMPWRDITFRSNMYSKEYANGTQKIDGWRVINWMSHWSDNAGVWRFNKDWTIKSEYVKIGSEIVEPDYSELVMPGVQKQMFKCSGWENHPDVMPDENLTIYAEWVPIDYRCVINWILNVYDSNGNVTHENYLTQSQPSGVALQYPDDPSRDGYIFTGWNDGRISTLDIIVPYDESKDIYGDLVSEEYSDYGSVSGYNLVYWRLPNHNPNQLDHDPYDIWKSQYVKYGDPIVAPAENPVNWTARDGFEYEFVKWDSFPSTMYNYKKNLNINAVDRRATKEFTLTYYLHKYDYGVTDWWEVYTTKKVQADAEIPLITISIEGWNWNGKWESYKDIFAIGKMPWRDYAIETKVYSDSYVEHMHPSDLNSYVLRWCSHDWKYGNWYTGVGEVYSSQILNEGDAIVEPTIDYENMIPPIPSSLQAMYSFDKWETHPSSMPGNNLDIFAVWKTITECTIIWTLRVYDENGNITEEEFTRTVQSVGSYLTYPDTTPSRNEYYFTEWEDGHVSTQMPIVPKKETWIIYGNLKSVYYIDGQQSGMTLVSWRIPNHDPNKLNHDPYDIWKQRYFEIGETIVDPSSTPDNWTALDGKTYAFVSWKEHSSTASGASMNIDANDTLAYATVKYIAKFWVKYSIVSTQTFSQPKDDVLIGDSYTIKNVGDTYTGWAKNSKVFVFRSGSYDSYSPGAAITITKDTEIEVWYNRADDSATPPDINAEAGKYIVKYWCGPTTSSWQEDTTTNRTLCATVEYADGDYIISQTSAVRKANSWLANQGITDKEFEQWVYYSNGNPTPLVNKYASVSPGQTVTLNVYATWKAKEIEPEPINAVFHLIERIYDNAYGNTIDDPEQYEHITKTYTTAETINCTDSLITSISRQWYEWRGIPAGNNIPLPYAYDPTSLTLKEGDNYMYINVYGMQIYDDWTTSILPDLTNWIKVVVQYRDGDTRKELLYYINQEWYNIRKSWYSSRPSWGDGNSWFIKVAGETQYVDREKIMKSTDNYVYIKTIDDVETEIAVDETFETTIPTDFIGTSLVIKQLYEEEVIPEPEPEDANVYVYERLFAGNNFTSQNQVFSNTFEVYEDENNVEIIQTTSGYNQYTIGIEGREETSALSGTYLRSDYLYPVIWNSTGSMTQDNNTIKVGLVKNGDIVINADVIKYRVDNEWNSSILPDVSGYTKLVLQYTDGDTNKQYIVYDHNAENTVHVAEIYSEKPVKIENGKYYHQNQTNPWLRADNGQVFDVNNYNHTGGNVVLRCNYIIANVRVNYTINMYKLRRYVYEESNGTKFTMKYAVEFDNSLQSYNVVNYNDVLPQAPTLPDLSDGTRYDYNLNSYYDSSELYYTVNQTKITPQYGVYEINLYRTLRPSHRPIYLSLRKGSGSWRDEYKFYINGKESTDGCVGEFEWGKTYTAEEVTSLIDFDYTLNKYFGVENWRTEATSYRLYFLVPSGGTWQNPTGLKEVESLAIPSNYSDGTGNVKLYVRCEIIV